MNDLPLGQITTIIMGQSPKGETYNTEGRGLPLLNGPTEFGPFHPNCTIYSTDARRLYQNGDLIFCVRGSTTGRMNWANKIYILGRGVCAIRGEDVLETKYLKYALDYSLESLLKLCGGGTFPNLTKDDLHAFRIPFPDHRRKIAAILSTYDDLIENNTRRIRILEQMAQTIYREWFVNFRFAGHEKVKLVESEMGMIPEGWEVKTVPEAININPTIKAAKDSIKPFVTMQYLSNNSMLINRFEYRTGNSGSKFINGDTLFARITPCLENGKTGFVQFLTPEHPVAIGSTEFIVLRSKTLCPEFVYMLARSDSFRDNAIKSMTGASGRQRVKEGCFDNYIFPHPPVDIIECFKKYAEPLFRQVQLLSVKSQNLRQIRDMLLPKLISGEVDVSELDINID